MGTAFLRHIQRTRTLIHIVDGSSPDPVADFSQVNVELALYDPQLARKPQVVAINKIDLPQVKLRLPQIERQFADRGFKVFAISALARLGLPKLLYAANQALQESEIEPARQAVPEYRMQEDPLQFEIVREPDGTWRVKGKAVERAAEMTYWEYDEAVRRFQRTLERMGVEEHLRQAGAQTGDIVRIGDHELEWQD